MSVLPPPLPSQTRTLPCSKYGLRELVCLGGFNNMRQEAAWQGFTLELDETSYPWGKLYELEAETVRMRLRLAGWLAQAVCAASHMRSPSRAALPLRV
jgi:hypothetical protein